MFVPERKRKEETKYIPVTSEQVLIKRIEGLKILKYSLWVFKINARVSYKINVKKSNNFHIFPMNMSMFKNINP